MDESSSESPSTEIAIRARYAETDAMGVVHHYLAAIHPELGEPEARRPVWPDPIDQHQLSLRRPVLFRCCPPQQRARR